MYFIYNYARVNYNVRNIYIASRCALHQCEMQQTLIIFQYTFHSLEILSLAISPLKFYILKLQLKSISLA